MDKFGQKTAAVGRDATRSSSKFAGFAKSIGAIAAPVALGAIATKIVQVGTDSIRAASDLQQSFGAIDSVFGKNSRAVKAWAADAANSVGLAKSQYANLAVVLGSTLKNTGVENFAGKTRDLIKLGADMAATYGGSTKDAVNALASALRGETDPIERFGVSIKQSAVNAELARRGQDKLTGAARTAAEQQARLALITRQSAAAHGAFARESDTLQGAQQRLGAKVENLKAKLGTALLPVMSKVVGWLSKTATGSNTTGKVLRKLASIYVSYIAPIFAGMRKGWGIVSRAFSESTGKGHGLGKVLGLLGQAAKKLAPIIGAIIGKAFVLLGRGIAIGIRAVDKLIGAFSSLIGWAKKVGESIGKIFDKIGKVGEKAAGLFRAAPHLAGGGLARASGAGYLAGAGGLTFSPTLVTSPTIVVRVGRRDLYATVEAVVGDVLRERDRRAAGGVRP